MKIKYQLLLFSFLLVSTAYGQRKPKIKGSRVVVEVREDLAPFTAIELNDDVDIVLQKSSDSGYSLEIDDNLVDVLKFRVVEGTLSISSFYDIRSKKKMKIIVFYDQLNSITLRDGKIDMEDVITTDELSISTYGSSKLKLNADAAYIDVLMLENSFADLTINADTLNIALKDRIDAKIYATSKTHRLEMFKNAQVKMEGNTEIFDIQLFESATLKAENLTAQEVSLKIEASTSAYVNASNLMSLDSKGTAKTYLYGSGKITILNFLDSSQLSKK
tara:strand:- start:65215 stop:66039 length:825 start_codon:yes stop_codon:yes gene_type:complete